MARVPNQDDLISAFLSTLPNVQTRRPWRTHLQQFARWCDEQGLGRVTDIATPHLHLYASYLETLKYKPNTRVSKQRTVKLFFDYLVETKTIRVNPVPGDWVPRVERSRSLPLLSEDDVLRMYEACRDHRRFLDIGMLVALAGIDGMKLKHISLLRTDEVTFDGDGVATVPVRRNDGTTHNRRLSLASSDHLRLMLADGREGTLFYPPQGASSSAGSARMRRDLLAVQMAAGVDGEMNPRRLERSYRTRLIEGGIPVEALVEVLGMNPKAAAYHRWTSLPSHGDGTPGRTSLDQATLESDAVELLAQAERLCDTKGVTPIAPIVIAGAALEMVLRRMCEVNDIVPQGRTSGISAYADALRSRTLISKHTHAVILANAKLRNEAAHGSNSSDVNIANARQMLRGVVLFIEGADSD